MQKLYDYTSKDYDLLTSRYHELYEIATSPWGGGYDIFDTHDLERVEDAIEAAERALPDDEEELDPVTYGCCWGEYALPEFEPVSEPIHGIAETAVAVTYVNTMHSINDMEWALYLHLEDRDGDLYGFLELVAREGYSDYPIMLRYRSDGKTADALAFHFPRRYWLEGMGDHPDVAKFAHPQLVKIAGEFMEEDSSENDIDLDIDVSEFLRRAGEYMERSGR